MSLTSNMEGRLAVLRPSIAEFVSGAVFGAALLGSGVYAPSVIRSQMSFRSNVMIVVMLGGSATSAIVQDLGRRSKVIRIAYPPPNSIGLFPYDANVLGGCLIGSGMGMTGSCPGTALVQAGVGMAQGILVLAGGVLGASAFVRMQPALDDLWGTAQNRGLSTSSDSPRSETKPPKARDLASALGLPPAALLLIWIPTCLAVMQVAIVQDESVRVVPTTGIVRPFYGGLLIGFAQLVTTVFAGHAIGASGAYEDVARWITKTPTKDSKLTTSFMTPSVIFSGGVIASGALLSHLLARHALLATPTYGSFGIGQAVVAVLGGISMGFGARLARGCTSGHGISGMARFSIASLITTAALFSAGIVTTAVFGNIGVD